MLHYKNTFYSGWVEDRSRGLTMKLFRSQAVWQWILLRWQQGEQTLARLDVLLYCL